MTLRLVLVSLVAGLGIGIPSWPNIEGWVASTQQWMNARLADMDVRHSDENNYVVIHDLLTVEMERAQAARAQKRAGRVTVPLTVAKVDPPNLTALPYTPATVSANSTVQLTAAPTVKPSAPSFEPLEVGDRLYVGTAYELNYRSEGLGLLPKVVALSATTPHAVQPAHLVELAIARYGAAGAKLIKRFDRDLREVATREIAAREFQAMENSRQLYFDHEWTEAPTTTVVEQEKPAVPEIVADLTGFDAMERSGKLYFADELLIDSPVAVTPEVLVEPAAPQPPAVATAIELPSLPDDAFAPADSSIAGIETMPIIDGPHTEAVDLNDEVVKSLEPSAALVSRDAGTEAAPRREVNRAVQLTREALSAWVNVLTGPALVTVSQSSTTIR